MRLHPHVRLSAVLVTESRRTGVRLVALSLMGIASGIVANQAQAGNNYFDTNGTAAGYGIATGGTYSWDAANWATASGGTSATGNFVPGSFAEFPGGGTGISYTVTVGADELMAGMYQTSSGTLTINQSSGTSGDLDVAAGLQGFLGDGSGSSVVINAPIVGTGGVELQVSSSTFTLNGVNTYSGGTTFYYSSLLTYFNNGSAFGTGAITIGESATTSYAPLLATAGATTTIANNWIMTEGGVNFAANANTPVVCTGNWSLGSTDNNLIRNNGTSSSPLTLSGVLSNTSTAASVTFSGANGGSIILSGANTYTGSTTVGVTGDTSTTLVLGASGTIASSTSLVLNGGTLNPDGLNQNMSATTLGLTASSKIDFGAGASTLNFANSSGLTWTGTLNLVNYNAGLDALQFGTNGTGLTTAQLADIEFNGTGLGTATLNSNGFLVVPSAAAAPEPSSWALIGPGALGMLALVRRRAKKS